MIKTLSFVFACLIAVNLMSSCAFSALSVVVPSSSTSINVKDYGAKGDGITDDTNALQQAVNAAAAQDKKWSMRVEHWGHLTKGAVDNPHMEIVFPAGTYKISRPIVLGRFAYLRGLDEATILQTDSMQDSLYFHGVQQAVVEGLNFRGGKTQLRFWTNNTGIATLKVEQCNFYDSSDFAIECRSYTQQVEGLDTTKPWAPYQVAWSEGVPTLTPNAPKNLKPWFNSTVTDIGHCRFENVMHAVNLSGDTGLIHDCEVITNPEMEGAVFRLEDLIYLHRIKGMARPNPEKRQYWIESSGNSTPATFYATLTLRDSVLDSEGAAGIAVVRSDLLPYGTSIILENSRVKSAGSREGALVTIAKGTQPNIISINNMTEISGKPVKAVAWEETPDTATLERIKDQPKGAVTDVIYKLQIGGNSTNIDGGVPEILQPLLLKPIPAAVLKATDVPSLRWEYSDLEAQALKTGKVLHAWQFGIDQNLETDDTANLQRLFDAAAQQGDCLVLLPSGVLRLSDTIQLPPRVVVRAAGTVGFVRSDGEKDLFEAKNAEQIAFRNCTFNGGRNGVNWHSNTDKKARLAFENCSFYDQQENGILALAGKGDTGEKNHTELYIQGGIMGTMRGLTTNASHSQIEVLTAVNDPHLSDDAFIRNLGGTMRIEAMLTNPKLWQGKRSEGKVPENIKDWQFSKNTRWVDNWGQYYSLDVRYGGECGGMTNIYNRSANSTVFISGGNTRFYNGATRKCALYLEKPARQAILQNIASPAARIDGSWAVMNADGSDGRSTPNVIVCAVPTP